MYSDVLSCVPVAAVFFLQMSDVSADWSRASLNLAGPVAPSQGAKRQPPYFGSMTTRQAPPDAAVHPMVPVPDALRTVLRETARSILAPSSSSSVTTVRLHPEVERLGSNRLCEPQRSAYEHVLGKTLAQDVHVVEPYPPFDASIMDGYAICCADLLVPGGEDRDGWTHRITSRIYAGDEIDDANTSGGIHSDEGKLPPAAYVTTGAVIPAPYDAVMPVEVVAVSADNQ